MTENDPITIRMLDTITQMEALEELQNTVWPGSERDIVPAHLLLTVAQNGGLVIGAFDGDAIIGFVFGFPGLVLEGEKLTTKHCSHMAGVHPDYRDHGLGFRLKRAQWQMVRGQKIDLITWTYDPLMSANANLNISKLGAVCNTYKREVYGSMRDGLNVGLPSDRFQVDWWVNTKRVVRRLSKRPRGRLDLAHFLAAGAKIVNSTQLNEAGWPQPPEEILELPEDENEQPSFLMVEIPPDFLGMKAEDGKLALEWRLHSRAIFEDLFLKGYITTDFVFLPGKHPRSYYVLSHGESTLGD